MKETELTGSARVATDAIAGAEHLLESGIGAKMAWFRLAYAALRILANIADALSKMDR